MKLLNKNMVLFFYLVILMSCSDPNISPVLKIVCDCQKAVNNFLELSKSYQASKAAHAIAKDIYDKAWRKYQNDLRDWETKKANKRKELVDETKVWKNCVLWTGVYGHDDWCQSDTGFGRQTGAGGYGCWDGQGKGVCQRTDYQVNEELNKWVGSNPSPIPPPGGSNGNVTPCSTCNPPLGNIIQCCANYMSGDSSTFKDNIQNCNQSIEQKIQEITGSPSNPVVPSNYTPLPEPSNSDVPSKPVTPSNSVAPFFNKQTNLSLLFIFIIGIICLFSSFLAILIV